MIWIYSFITTSNPLRGKRIRLFKKNYLLLAMIGCMLCFQTAIAQTPCIATYQIETLPDGTFQVSLISSVNYDSSTTPPEDQINTMQVTIRVNTGGFAVANFNDLRHGFINWNITSYNAPLDNPGFDYISFTLNNPTAQIPFQDGLKIPLFTFENGGACTADVVELIDLTDPFYPPNSSNSNAGQQLTILGYGQPDAPICLVADGAQDCSLTCGIEYKISKRSDGRFLVSMIPQVTYLANDIDNYVSTMQVVIKVPTGSFQVVNISDLVHATSLWNTTDYNSPSDNPGFNYIAFGLKGPTDSYPIIAGQEVPLFTFENGGTCTNNAVTLIDNTDPFYPPNNSNSNSGQQMTVGGYGSPDIPICVSGSGAQDCSANCFLSCNDNIQVSLGLNCEAEILPDMVATALDLTCPGGVKSVEVRNLDNTLLFNSPVVNQSNINQTFLVSVVDNNTGNSCWGSIIVKDKTGPSINCQDLVVDCSEPLNPNNPFLGFPNVRDNCFNDAIDLTYTDEVDPNGCNSIYSTIVNRTWSANDGSEHGISSNCIQKIYLIGLPLDDIVFPTDQDGIDAPALSCEGGTVDPEISGGPMLNGKSIYPSYEGYCDINVGFQDQIASRCGGSSQILRTWTAVNNCTGSFKTSIQVISLLDLTAPIIECIADTLEQTTGIHDCSTTFSLPSINVSDACSGVSVYMQTPNGIINSNGGFLEDIEQGVHPIIYVATDECGNEARCTTMIRITDQNGPTAICNDNQVAIGASGWVDVPASSFDDGSFDDCCSSVTFLAERTDQMLGLLEELSFGCEDIGTTIPVILQVTDCYGNISQCTANIAIINDNTTNIQCPPDLAIACTTDYSDLNLFGAPTLADNCGEPIFQVQNTFTIDSCGAGVIVRDFFILDGDVPTGNCTQVIIVENESTFNEQHITWPHDYLTLACGFESLDPDDLPFGFNKPKYEVSGSCNNIFVRYTDSEFDNSANAEGCYEIHRRWEVIDWCKYDPDNPIDGIFTYTQVINILNNVPPVFNCPQDITIDIEDENCVAFANLNATAVDDCTPGNLITYTYSVDQDSDGTQDISGIGGNASGPYPIGTHIATFTAADDCNNSATCSYSFTVRDRTPPIALCFFPDVVIEDHNGNKAAIPNGNAIGKASVDNCTVFEDLTFRVQPSFFTCDEVGSNTITLTVTDQSGNASSCRGNINVVDLLNTCPRLRSMVSISGNIMNEDGAMIENVQVSLDYHEVLPSMTNQEGKFQLDSVPVGGDYTVFPNRNDAPLNGISTFDLVVLNRHILGVQFINSPYKLIAADVNRSGSITTYDLVILRRLILRNIDDFPNNTSWRFVSQDHLFDNPANPFEDFFPEVYAIENTPSNDMNIGNFIAIKVGDINNSARPDYLVPTTKSEARSTGWSLQIPQEQWEAGSIVEIPISSSNWEQVLGFQFGLQWNTDIIDVLEIQPVSIPNFTKENFGLQQLSKGLLTVSWQQLTTTTIQEQVLFILKVKVKSTTNSLRAITLNQEWLSSEAYQEVSTMPTVKELSLVATAPISTTVLYQNQPNPFQRFTTISFEVPTKGPASLRIINRHGQLIKQVQAEYTKGYHEIYLQKEDFPRSGMYYYQLETMNAVETKKMLVIE